jgi:uncharacterized protein (DUF1800 family)
MAFGRPRSAPGGVPAAQEPEPMAAPPTVPTASLSPIDRAAWTADHARHLLWRAGFGGTPKQIAFLASMPPEDAVSAFLDFDRSSGYPDVKPDDFDDSIMTPPTEEQRREIQRVRRAQDEDTLAKIRLARQQREQQDRRQMNAMQRWWLRRLIESPRPMEEKLALFWHGHFATSYRTIENSYHMFLQNQLFRRHAAGSFADLLHAIVRDPAMIAYLDNNESRKGKPNENLARELLELFSLGEGRYTEKDIKEGARALTGHTFEHNAFVFRREWHDEGSKTILGKSGSLDGEGFVRAILDRRDAAEFITMKLYRFFVHDLPPTPEARRVAGGVVKQLATTLLSAKYEVRPMLRRLLLSEHFYDPANRLARIKSPVELVVGVLRSLNTPVRDLGILNDALDLMGQSLFYPPSVKGWDGGRSWINTSTLFVRQNVTNFLLTGKTPRGYDPLADTQTYDFLPLLMEASEAAPGAEKHAETLAAYLVRFALGRDLSSEKQRVLTEYLQQQGGINAASAARTLALITSLPEYQLC